ncbi:PilZ domain-containing protein [Acinetobacter sp. B5B]|uniref:PilZ domain-containing protein n=1 Tax=Acinetobacter baretiae TaxID=2605383 RepID=UPI0018C34823|nr:PilZ domain-containing protein [Acinetobacter baretiae]MBF7683153.1 PilZ domain-containing protein [Acinetobacter baretiae]MBF7684547.1 PilZ domain-containing protein [Acinetobacter baretiae]
MQTMQRGGVLQVNITDINVLQASYMPYVTGGGLFVPSAQVVSLGEDIFLLATLPGQNQKIPLTGKVIWINHEATDTKPQGFGIQLAGEKGRLYQEQAEKMLGNRLYSPAPSYTI